MSLNVQVKSEPGEEFDEAVNSEEYACLYKNHAIKDELVIGPEIVHGDILSESTNNMSYYNFNVTVKTEKFDKPTEEKLNMNKENSHNGESYKKNNQYLCKLCFSTFSFKSSLSRHTKAHISGKSFTCEVCKKRFAAKWNLTQHLRIHTKSKYQCQVCGKFVTNLSCFYRHMLTHKGKTAKKNERFFCDSCQRSYGRKCELVRHIRGHVEKVRYQCHFCHKNYVTRNKLNNHLRKHD